LEEITIKSAPNDHFTAGPDCRVFKPAIGRAGGAGSGPAVCAWVVSAARVQTVESITRAVQEMSRLLAE